MTAVFAGLEMTAERGSPVELDRGDGAALRPRLCSPYRAQTEGKVERFIRYVRGSFWVPSASRLRQDGLDVDRETANVAVRRWLRVVANARVHATTGEVPQDGSSWSEHRWRRCRRLIRGRV